MRAESVRRERAAETAQGARQRGGRKKRRQSELAAAGSTRPAAPAAHACGTHSRGHGGTGQRAACSASEHGAGRCRGRVRVGGAGRGAKRRRRRWHAPGGAAPRALLAGAAAGDDSRLGGACRTSTRRALGWRRARAQRRPGLRREEAAPALLQRPPIPPEGAHTARVPARRVSPGAPQRPQAAPRGERLRHSRVRHPTANTSCVVVPRLQRALRGEKKLARPPSSTSPSSQRSDTSLSTPADSSSPSSGTAHISPTSPQPHTRRPHLSVASCTCLAAVTASPSLSHLGTPRHATTSTVRTAWVRPDARGPERLARS